MAYARVQLRCLLFWILTFVHLYMYNGITEGADTSAMERDIRNYFSKTRHHDVDQAYKDRAMNYILDEFKRLGLETELQNFQETRVSDTKNFTNVIGILRGERFGNISDRIVGVAAHYDTVKTTAGVDDNGAGVVAMLDVARQLTEMNRNGQKRNNTIIFVSFDVEEQGLYGSEAFVKYWLPSFFVQHYGPEYMNIKPYGVIVMDTIMEFNRSARSQILPPFSEDVLSSMFPKALLSLKSDDFQGDFILLIYRNDSMDDDLANMFSSSWGQSGQPDLQIESFPLPIEDVSTIQGNPIFGNFLRSDHTSFWLSNLPAIFLSDSANFRGDMIFCYHNPCDNLEVMLTEDNINFLGKTADSITKTLDMLSETYQKQVSTAVTARWSLLLALCLAFYVLEEQDYR